MEFKPGKITKNHNVSEVSTLREFAVLISGISAIILLIYFVLGFAVDSIVNALPDDWADSIYENTIYKDSLYDDIAYQNQGNSHHVDLAKTKMLQTLVNDLAVCADIQYPVTISLTKSDQVNAMALPQGHIIVLSGLLNAVQSQNGLSFVLAHELAHFKNRDHLRQMGRGIILLIIIHLISGDGFGFSEAFTPAMMAGEANYSQEREMQADNRATEILHCHYGHVGGATELFEYFQGEPVSILQNSFLASHPAPRERIDNIHQLTETNDWQIKRTTALDLSKLH